MPPPEADGSGDDIRNELRRGEDFLGAFAVLERGNTLLMVENRRQIHGREVSTWDLPGGQVEPGELLTEALAREVREETGLVVVGDPQLLFVQEGERCRGGRRRYAWRSFFFGCRAMGEPRAAGEVINVRWIAREDLAALLTAPYHDSFSVWLREGGSFHGARWAD